MSLNILYVEDDEGQRKLITDLIRKNKFNVIDTHSPIEGLKKLQENKIDLVVSDFRMPDMNGYEFLKEVKKINPFISFILVTAYGDIELAVKTIKKGAIDFITKPFHFDKLLEKIKEVERNKFLDKEVEKIKTDKTDTEQSLSFSGVIGNSNSFKEVLSKIPRIALTNAPILIIGESGTGKEVIADLIQSHSNRKSKPYIKINCSAIPKDLIESELFGYEKGAFTGAISSKKGQIEVADGGTLFLDEIGEFPYQLQSKLLRFLQNSEIQKIGSRTIKKLDVRIISATNKKLKKQIQKNKFREDLYFRLNVINLQLPPLRERKEDIPLLIDYFMEIYSNINDISKKTFSEDAMNKIIKYNFPGNIRELANIVQNTIILSIDNVIKAEDIPLIDIKDISKQTEISIPENAVDMTEFIGNIEKKLIIKSLDRNHWNQSKAAKELNITLRILRYKIEKYDIKK